MSGKTVIFLALVALAGYSLTRAKPPVAPGATPADSAAVAQAGIGARFEYGVGAFGSKVVGASVRGMVSSTEQSLKDMGAAIKAANKIGGLKAALYAKKTTQMDSVALSQLQLGHPINAVQSAMDAKSLLNSVRDYVR
jgi:hypothetical protein